MVFCWDRIPVLTMQRPPASRKLSPLWRAAFFILTAVFVWTVGVWLWERMSRSRVTAVLTESARVRLASSGPTEPPRGSIALADLGLVGGLFSTDEARRAEVAERIRQIARFGRACQQPGDGPLDFRQVLRDLRVRVPDGMTNEAAADEFLRRVAGPVETLRLLRQDLERGPWDWGRDVWRNPEEWPQRNEFFSLFSGAPVLTAVMEAEWLTGRGGGAGQAGVEIMRLQAEQAARLNDFVGLGLHATCLAGSTEMMQRGIARGLWSDQELEGIVSNLPTGPTLVQARDALEAKKRELLWRMESQPVIEEVRDSMPSARLGKWRTWEEFEAGMAGLLITDTHIKDGFAVAIADMNEEMSRIDPASGTYTPVDRETIPSALIRKGATGWERGLTEPIRIVVGNERPFAMRSVVGSEQNLHKAQLMAALDLYHRQHGRYPAALDEIGATRGEALPRKSLAGTAYEYQRDEAAGYRVRMEGGLVLMPPGSGSDAAGAPQP